MVHTDFIEVYEDVLDGASSRELIDSFERSQLAQPIVSAESTDSPAAEGWAIALDAHPAWADATGLLALFPAYMWHGVEPRVSDEPRLTVAFDAVPDAP
jgi:hypothetical protein